MKSKTKLTIFLALIGLVVLAGIVIYLNGYPVREKTVKIVDYELSVCTADVPISDCGPHDVTVELDDGRETIYTIEGFSNGRTELYNEVTPKIIKAKLQNSQVTLKINNKGEIISVR